jgi:cation-transporting ATPase E
LGLLPLLEPPVGESMSGADADGADVRPTVLALAMLALYGAFFLVPPLREFFELSLLAWADVAVICVAAVVWAILVLVMWRTRLVDRLRSALSRQAAD